MLILGAKKNLNSGALCIESVSIHLINFYKTIFQTIHAFAWVCIIFCWQSVIHVASLLRAALSPQLSPFWFYPAQEVDAFHQGHHQMIKQEVRFYSVRKAAASRQLPDTLTTLQKNLRLLNSFPTNKVTLPSFRIICAQSLLFSHHISGKAINLRAENKL